MTTQTLPRTGMQSLMPILTIGLLFFIFGFVTWLNGALIPFLQMVCELSEMEALFIAFCFYVWKVIKLIDQWNSTKLPRVSQRADPK